jgi:2-methylcitrate dehydratase PrpD
VAAALVDGEIGIDTFTEEKIADGVINETMGKVRTRVMAKAEELLTESANGLKVKITLKDGRVFEHTTAREDTLGSQKNPWGFDAIKEKFQENVSRVLSADGTAKAMETWENIPEMTDIATAIRSTLVAEKA